MRPASVRCVSGVYPVIDRPSFGLRSASVISNGLSPESISRQKYPEKSWAQNLKPYSKPRQLNSGRVAHPVRAGAHICRPCLRTHPSSPRVPHFSRVLCAREVGPWQWHTAQGHSRHAHFHLQYSPVVDPHRSHFAVRIRRKLLHFRNDAPGPSSIGLGSAPRFKSGYHVLI